MSISLLQIRTPVVRLSLSSRNAARILAAPPLMYHLHFNSRYRFSSSLRTGGSAYLSYFTQSRRYVIIHSCQIWILTSFLTVRPDLSCSEMFYIALANLLTSMFSFNKRHPRVFPFIDRTMEWLAIIGGIILVPSAIL